MCTKEPRARKGVHSSLKLRGRGDFLALETSGYSLTCFTSLSPGIHYSGKFWRFLLPSFLPFLLLLPKTMQGLLLSFFTAFFIWQKHLCCGGFFFLYLIVLMSVLCLLESSDSRKHPILKEFSKFTKLI